MVRAYQQHSPLQTCLADVWSQSGELTVQDSCVNAVENFKENQQLCVAFGLDAGQKQVIVRKSHSVGEDVSYDIVAKQNYLYSVWRFTYMHQEQGDAESKPVSKRVAIKW